MQYEFWEKRLTIQGIKGVSDIACDKMKKKLKTRKVCVLITIDINNAFNSAN